MQLDPPPRLGSKTSALFLSTISDRNTYEYLQALICLGEPGNLFSEPQKKELRN